MFKLVFIVASVTGLFLAPLAASAPAAIAPPEVANIGFVLYTKSLAPGTLNARWMFGTKYRGPGIATGGPKSGFAGNYHVRYFYDTGEFSDEYDLVIEKADDAYKASWIANGQLQAVGIGMEVENGLAIGWRRVRD